jgi:hypothetical protein
MLMGFAVFFRSLNNELADRGDQPVMLATAKSLFGLSVSEAADRLATMNAAKTDVAMRTTVDGYRAALSDKGDLRDIKF